MFMALPRPWRAAAAPAIAALLLALWAAPRAPALTLNPIGEFEAPTYVTSEPNDPDRLLVTERLGKIELVDHGKVSTFADLTSLVGCQPSGCEGERGLMSLAPAPDFASSGHVYVDYISEPTGEIHVDELTAEGDSAPLSTLRPLLTIPHPDASNHNGGQLQFGPDGYLYVSTGDGGGGDDQFHNSQNLNSPLGKILRVDPNQSSPTPTVWSYGLRNPFRFSFDRLTGDLVIADVGQSAREEVDFAPRLPDGEVGGDGTNWGWNCREGFIAGPGDDLPPGQCEAEASSFAEPVFDYPHTDPGGGAAHGCAIIGGYVVRDPSLGDLYGRYIYGDLCVGEIRSLQLPATGTGLATGDRGEGVEVPDLNSFGEDSCRRLYAVSGEGEVSRLEGPTPATCPPPDESLAPPSSESPPKRSHVRLRANRHRVAPGDLTTLTARVNPCDGRDGQRIALDRGGRKVATRPLNEGCTVRFHPRVYHRSTFRAVVPATDAYLAGRSPQRVVDTVTGPR
jgi:Glucose / Sorbosone dehydrogenase